MKYHNWMQFIPAGMIITPFSYLRWLEFQGMHATAADVVSIFAWDTLAVLIGWQVNAGLVLQKAGRTDTSEPADIAMAASQVRRIPELNEMEQVVELRDLSPKAAAQMQKPKREEQVLDSRIQQWAYGVIYQDAPMTQTWWCVGKGKLFTKPAYVAWIGFLLANKVIRVINPNAEKSSYELNGRAGYHYVKALADGRMYLPFPAYEVSEKSGAFLRAQVRKKQQRGRGKDPVES